MQTIREKLGNMGSIVRRHARISMATIQEKGALVTARTKDEKKMVRERRKTREAEANMQLHQAKANHKAQKLNSRHARLMHGQTAPEKGAHTQSH